MFHTFKNKRTGRSQSQNHKSRENKNFRPALQGLEERISLTVGSTITITNPPTQSPSPTQWSFR